MKPSKYQYQSDLARALGRAPVSRCNGVFIAGNATRRARIKRMSNRALNGPVRILSLEELKQIKI